MHVHKSTASVQMLSTTAGAFKNALWTLVLCHTMLKSKCGSVPTGIQLHLCLQTQNAPLSDQHISVTRAGSSKNRHGSTENFVAMKKLGNQNCYTLFKQCPAFQTHLS